MSSVSVHNYLFTCITSQLCCLEFQLNCLVFFFPSAHGRGYQPSKMRPLSASFNVEAAEWSCKKACALRDAIGYICVI